MGNRNQSQNSARAMAFGGIMAALALVIMTLGGMIPLATFVCPVAAMLILQLVFRMFGGRIGWTWYGAVAILSALLSPDKEGAAFFLFFGFYPLIKPKMDKLPLSKLWKLIYFNVMTLAMYGLLIWVLGMDALLAEFQEMGTLLAIITLVLGNVCFVLIDVILSRRFRRR